LIRYRPSPLSWRKGETAADISTDWKKKGKKSMRLAFMDVVFTSLLEK
jgi:hypothetical protein